MNLEQQVCSLGLAKKLKELGVKQGSVFTWIKALYAYPEREEWSLWSKWEIEYEGSDFGTLEEQQDYAAAFTVAELGEMLPEVVQEALGIDGLLRCSKLLQGDWRVTYEDNDGQDFVPAVEAATEADARAKMLIYLIENKLMTV